MIVFPEKTSDTKSLIFDSHAHFYDEKFDTFRDELLKELPSRGVGAVINCGCDKKSSEESIILSEKYDYMYSAVGIHPGNLDSGTMVEEIEKLASHKKCVAIGEIGLDYYWEPEKAEEQKKIFKEQLILASKLGLPVIVHDREAHGDTLEILKEYKPKGVLHSFSGSPEMARELIKLNILKNCMDDGNEMAALLAERTHSQVVQVIGKKIVLYKEAKDEKKRKIVLPK